MESIPEKDARSSPISMKHISVSGLPLGTSWQDLKDLMRQACVSTGLGGNVLRCDVQFDSLDPNSPSNGRGHVVFEKTEDAEKAIELFHGSQFQGNTLTVTHDQSKNQAVQEGRQIFVSNLPYILRWNELKSLFETVGKVIRCDLVQGHGGKSKGMGIVVMSSSEEAQRAVELLNNHTVMNRQIQVRLDRMGHLSFLQPHQGEEARRRGRGRGRGATTMPMPSVYIDSTGQMYYVATMVSPGHHVSPHAIGNHPFPDHAPAFEFPPQEHADNMQFVYHPGYINGNGLSPQMSPGLPILHQQPILLPQIPPQQNAPSLDQD